MTHEQGQLAGMLFLIREQLHNEPSEEGRKARALRELRLSKFQHSFCVIGDTINKLLEVTQECHTNIENGSAEATVRVDAMLEEVQGLIAGLTRFEYKIPPGTPVWSCMECGRLHTGATPEDEICPNCRALAQEAAS